MPLHAVVPIPPTVVAPSADDQRCLSEAVYYEAGFEPLAGRKAVAQVVLNRLRSPGFPKTVCGVVYQRTGAALTCQFTFVCDGSLTRRRAVLAWQEADQVAREALDGDGSAVVGDALNYHAWYVKPMWSDHLAVVARIGAHIFYHGKTSDSDTRTIHATLTPDRHVPDKVLPTGSSFTPWGLKVYR